MNGSCSSKAIIKEHGGIIEIASDSDSNSKGTVITIKIPVHKHKNIDIVNIL